MTFTARQISQRLGVTAAAIRQQLRGIAATGEQWPGGVRADAWMIGQLPESLLARLDAAALQQRCKGATTEQRVQVLLSMPCNRWEPDIPLDKICEADMESAGKLREALRPWLLRQHDIKPGELKSGGLESCQRTFGNGISPRHFDRLFARTVTRDGGAEQWDRLEIYLPEKVRPKADGFIDAELHGGDGFESIHRFIAEHGHSPNEFQRSAIWMLVLESFSSLVSAGESEKSASLRVRDFLFVHAPFLAASKNALRMAWDRKLERWQRGQPESIADGRKGNGNRADYPSKDIRRVRHSAVLKNGKRIDAAWREEYHRLSEYTRGRHPRSRRCPTAFYQLVSRQRVDALYARIHGRSALRKLAGSVDRDAANMPAMASWAVDDWTSNIEIACHTPDGKGLLIQPQIITVMDYASRKWVGWSMSNDKGPTAQLVCAAVLDGFRRHGVPRQLWVENGFVFGKSLNVNGKEDEQGRTVVAGLAQYGCEVHHFHPGSPTSKGELEKSFDLVQRLMERHPGYAGRLQMLDASDEFKREQRLINSGKVDAKTFRYTKEEFNQVMHQLVEEYNSTPQHGHLNGLTPNDAFEALADPTNPPIKFNNQLQWILANERYRVTVKVSGVQFTHYGRKIKVRGGDLPLHHGEELWAVVDRQDGSMVTFMTLDYSKTFTVEVCQNPSARESLICTGSSVLAAELKKIGKHVRAVTDELKDLTAEFGNPRKELLAEIRGETATPPTSPTRQTVVAPQLLVAGDQMGQQREAIREEKRESVRLARSAARVAEETGLHLSPSGVSKLTPEQLRMLKEINEE